MNPITARPLFRVVALLTIFLLPSVAAAQIPQFDCFYVFGDSLADNGNILIQTTAKGMKPPAPPSATPHLTYFNGRFSNGYVGVEYLWERLSGQPLGPVSGLRPFLESPFAKKGCAVNFAFGGTGTPYVDQTPGGFYSPGLRGQVELFRLALRGKKPSSRALYAISTGANDYRDTFNVPMSPVDVVRNIENAIVSLYRLGARDILVLDLPDLGKIPANVIDPVVSARASALSAYHNSVLYAALDGLQRQYPELHLIPVTLAPLFEDLQKLHAMEAYPPLIAKFSPNPLAAACLFINPVLCTDLPEFLFNAHWNSIFWDIVHPTTEAHEYLGDYMFDQLAHEYE